MGRSETSPTRPSSPSKGCPAVVSASSGSLIVRPSLTDGNPLNSTAIETFRLSISLTLEGVAATTGSIYFWVALYPFGAGDDRPDDSSRRRPASGVGAVAADAANRVGCSHCAGVGCSPEGGAALRFGAVFSLPGRPDCELFTGDVTVMRHRQK